MEAAEKKIAAQATNTACFERYIFRSSVTN